MALRDVLVHFGVTVDQKPLIDAQKNVDNLIRRFNGLWRIAGFALAALGVGRIIEAADEYLVLENKLKAVTEGTQEFTQAQKGVEQIADSLAQPVTDVADSFLRYKLATESLGASQEEVLDFTKRVTQAMVLSGATSEEAHRAAVQLSQGFGKNFKAAAQDLKSVKEQAPVLARIIEKAAGGLPGTLLVMAKEGKITSKLVFDSVRAEGAKLDEEWKEHQKTFGEVGNLYGNTFLLLIKRLRPYIVQFISALEEVAKWFKAWVEDGSVMNTLIAGTITLVGALTVAFGGLALAVAAAVAPWVIFFLLLEDFVAFLRGDESEIGNIFNALLGEGGEDKARAAVKDIWALLKEFASWLTTPERWAGTWKALYDGMVEWVGKAVEWSKGKLAELGDSVADQLRGALGDRVSDLLGVPKTGQREYERGMSAREDRMAAGKAEYDAAMNNRPGQVPGEQLPQWWDVFTGGTSGKAFQGPTGLPDPMAPDPWAFRNAKSYADIPPQITNNITVQGNADAPVAREIATRTGAATADSLGRDRSAVGAGFGIAP